MRISLNWLKSYVDFKLTPEELSHLLTMAGLEVSSIERIGKDLDKVVVGKILEKSPHPNADRLSLCKISDGANIFDVVCGASNMKANDKVAFAKVGASLPGGVTIKDAEIRGVPSRGMLCSSKELGLTEESSGILILSEDFKEGTLLSQALDLPDAVLELEITPNRPDCLSIVGVARDIAAITGSKLNVPEPKFSESETLIEALASVENSAPELCHRYTARVIEGVKIGSSPLWLKNKLHSCGLRPINNIVDATNYVLMELGHPLHAFDLQKLTGNKIIIKRASNGSKFTTLDGQERLLDRENLVICDSERPVALAGIMGGQNSEVQTDTVDILLESAYFLPSSIRRTSKKLGISTDASYRFERGADIDGMIRSLNRCAELIVALAGGRIAKGLIDVHPTPHSKPIVELRHKKITSVLGVSVPRDEVHRLLTCLGIKIIKQDELIVSAEIPFHRPDVEREIDLIEEIARLRGYDLIPESLPRIPMTCEPIPRISTISELSKTLLAAWGFREAITLSFSDSLDHDRMGYPEQSVDRQSVKLQNPLSAETEELRTSLLPGLLKAASINFRRQEKDVCLFEIGRVFHAKKASELPEETTYLTAIAAGARHPLSWCNNKESMDYFDIKGITENLLAQLGITDASYTKACELSSFHPGRSAAIKSNEKLLGSIGQIHPECLKRFDIPHMIFSLNINLTTISKLTTGVKNQKNQKKYPSIERDFAFIVSETVLAQNLHDIILSIESKLIRSVTLFDVYKGDPLPKGNLSLAFRVIYRSDERTLTETEIEKLDEKIFLTMKEKIGAVQREG